MTPFVLVLGIASLIAPARNRIDSIFAGRAYVAYDGIYIDRRE